MPINEHEICKLLQQYIEEYPVFRLKPIGASGSFKRNEQERQIKLENAALKALFGKE
jgi:hypothetical protein